MISLLRVGTCLLQAACTELEDDSFEHKAFPLQSCIQRPVIFSVPGELYQSHRQVFEIQTPGWKLCEHLEWFGDL